MARSSNSAQAAALWTWSAIAAGVITALIVQALLTMLALGVGLLSIDLPAANNAPATISTAALLWWIASGVFSAFAGGAVAGAYAPVADERARTVHAVAAWAVASLIVIGATSMSTGGAAGLVGHMAGPGASVNAQSVTVSRPQQQVTMSAAQIEQARKAAATAMLASFVGLLAGALAAAMGGWWGRDMAREMNIPAGQRV